MSTQSVLNFCNKLHDSLNARGGSRLYRDLVSDKRVHIFKFSSVEMAKQMKIELESHPSFGSLTQEDRTVINRLAKEMHGTLKRELTKEASKNKNSKLKSSNTTLSFRFDSNTNSGKVITFRSGKTLDPSNVFGKVKHAYRPALKTFFTKVQEHLKSTLKVNPDTGRIVNRSVRTKSGRTAKGPSAFFHAGHEKGRGVFESFIRDAFEGIASSTKLDSDVTANDLTHVLGVKTLIKVRRDDKKDSHTISIESQYLNTQGKAGGADVSTLRRKLKKELKKAIEELEKSQKIGIGLVDLQGSDSIYDKKKKKLRGQALKPFKKLKNVKVAATSTKTTSKSSSTTRKGSAGGRAGFSATKLGAGVVARRLQKSKGKAKASPASSPLAMIVLLNKGLPDIVRKNMQEPALVNRTGRFADSVRVTDVVKTPKGFPSVGYTYQRNPYQVFEDSSSGAWSNGHRDPRKLIDKSIREIAVKLAIGRFYTRRV